MKILGALVVTLFLAGCGSDLPLVETIQPDGTGGGSSEMGTGGGSGGGLVVVECPRCGIPLIPQLPTQDVDAGQPDVDSGTPDEDAGVVEVDAGEPEVDAGMVFPGNSGNTPRCDAGQGKKLGLIKHGKCE